MSCYNCNFRKDRFKELVESLAVEKKSRFTDNKVVEARFEPAVDDSDQHKIFMFLPGWAVQINEDGTWTSLPDTIGA